MSPVQDTSTSWLPIGSLPQAIEQAALTPAAGSCPMPLDASLLGFAAPSTAPPQQVPSFFESLAALMQSFQTQLSQMLRSLLSASGSAIRTLSGAAAPLGRIGGFMPGASCSPAGFHQGMHVGGLPLAQCQISEMPGAPRSYGRHTGVDFAAPTGTPIQAVADGTVVRAGVQGGYGLCVTIRHADGHLTRYAHCSERSVKAGDHVRKGQLIGRVGATGHATGPHLHFDVIAANGRYCNPLAYLQAAECLRTG